MHTQYKNRNGFTLIEILVVIGIIAVLAAILFSVFAQTRAKARAATGETNIRQIAYATLQYMQDNDEKPPRVGFACLGPGENGMPAGMQNQCGGDEWQNVIAPYVKSAAIFTSPGDQSHRTQFAPGFLSPTDFEPSDGNLSLILNDNLAHHMRSKTVAGTTYANADAEEVNSDPLPLSAIKSPTECVLLCEGHGGWDKTKGKTEPILKRTDWTGSTDLLNKWHREYSISGAFTPFLAGADYEGNTYFIGVPFTNNGGNVAYVDGHVQFKVFADANGRPALCSSLPWPRAMDPLQRGIAKPDGTPIDSCRDPNNPVGAGFGTPNWY